jgi:hypothetical protein
MRYAVLVLLNMPVVMLAFTNILVQYKMKKISEGRFRQQITLWLVIFIALVGSFPIYNRLVGNPLLDSSELSLFDITEMTGIIYLIYVVNNQRRKIEQAEKTLRDLHQEISIRLSGK